MRKDAPMPRPAATSISPYSRAGGAHARTALGLGRAFLTGAMVLTLAVTPAWAHGGDHHHEEPAQPAATVRPTAAGVSRSAVSEQYELVLTLDAATTGAPRQLRLYLSDFASNEPVPDATLTIDWGNDLITSVTATAQAGIYAGEVTFPQAGSYSPLVTIQAAAGDDLLTVDPFTVSPPGAAGNPDSLPWTYAAGIGAAAAALIWRLTRRKGPSAGPRPEVTP